MQQFQMTEAAVRLLSELLNRSSTHSTRTGTSDARDRRDTERHDVSRPVSIGPPGAPPLPGTVINLSVSGAAIRIDGWDTGARAAWFVPHVAEGPAALPVPPLQRGVKSDPEEF